MCTVKKSDGYVMNAENLKPVERVDSEESDLGTHAKSEDMDGSGGHEGPAELAYISLR